MEGISVKRPVKVLIAVAAMSAVAAVAMFGGVGATTKSSSSPIAPPIPSLASLRNEDIQISLNVSECPNTGLPPFNTALLQWNVSVRWGLQKYLTQGRDGRYYYNGTQLNFRLTSSYPGTSKPPEVTWATSDWLTLAGHKRAIQPNDVVQYRLKLENMEIYSATTTDKVDGTPYPKEYCSNIWPMDSVMNPTWAFRPGPPEAWKRP